MTMTSVDVDLDVLEEAAKVLGTKTKRDTINMALQQVLQARRAEELLDLLQSGVLEIAPDMLLRSTRTPRTAGEDPDS